MKVHLTLLTSSKFWIVCAVLCITSVCQSVNPQTNTDAKKPASNAPAAPVAPPQAVFKLPNNQQEGRDPFFPKSIRPYANRTPVVVATNPVAAPLHVELKLQGISGPPNHRLPIINGRTFELNEEAEVNAAGGRVAVKVLQIKGDTVVVQAAGERQELKLKGGL
jgi:hypothetical protein